MPAPFELIVARGQGAYYCEDSAALSTGPVPDSERWTLPGVTHGFRFAREVADVVSVGIASEATVAWGDCVGVSYAGKAGRAPVLRAADLEQTLRERVAPALKVASLSSFRSAGDWLAGQTFPPAIAYGLSQALLVHFAGPRTATETLCAEWNLPLPTQSVPLHGSCGNNRFENADKMIVNRLAALPHTQVEEVLSQFGADGQGLLDYANWIVLRLAQLAPPTYRPALHFDLHGAWGKVFSPSRDKGLGFAERLVAICQGYEVTVESPVVENTLDLQVEAMRTLRQQLKQRGIPLRLAVDEWVNSVGDVRRFVEAEATDTVHLKLPNFGSLHETIEALRLCQANRVKTLLGGSCIETDLSARLTAHVALAFRPSALLVKPGMGIDEGISLMRNEMSRTLATLQFRNGGLR